MKSMLKIPVLMVCIIALTTCIDPYYPELGNYESLMVVDGLVTDKNIPSEVRLTKTFQTLDSVPEKISDAIVYVTDEAGNRANFYYSGDGVYKSRTSEFSGQPGKTYTLHIETVDGKKYLSEPCVMFSVPGIDSVYYTRREKINSATGNEESGIEISLDSDETNGDNEFLRWEYEETWKFRMPFPQKYIFVSDSEIIELKNIKEHCWKTNKSNEILTNLILPDHNSIKNEALCFIPPAESDRLTIQYSILVKQFSISSREYTFWNNLKQVNETGGNIFDTQPYPVISNIYNIGDPDEKVLGYFKVSAVKEKRIFITANDIKGLNLPSYKYSCQEFVVSPENYPAVDHQGTLMTWDQLYEMFMAAVGFTFIRPIYAGQPGILYKLVFASKECSDCGLTGDITRPDFWIDLP